MYVMCLLAHSFYRVTYAQLTYQKRRQCRCVCVCVCVHRYAEIINKLTWMTHALNLQRMNEDYHIGGLC